MSAEFDDGKDDGALRTIGEVSKALDIKAHVLRYWEQQFPMLEPLKRSGGRRYYRPEDVALVERIDYLVNGQGYTLKGAKQVIEEGGSEVTASVETAVIEQAAAPALPVSKPVVGDAPVAEDGGLASFFGAPEPQAETTAEGIAADDDENVPEPSRLPRAEIAARLKVIHGTLAEAIRV